ncbi:MAG: hypothetical protein E3J72_12045 [Planctomycetota bacterium]|nr:MAG: hypothetical protein E3J72_12045 [Planctomycetota bacterium]
MAKAKKKKASKASARKQAKTAKAKTGKPKGATAPAQKKKKAPPAELATLKKKAEEARTELVKAENEANALRMQAKSVESVAKKAYAEAVAPYREACRRAGVECEFAGGKAGCVTERVSYLVEKVKGGIRIMIKGRPETDEVISFKTLDKSIGKAAVAYMEKFIGAKEAVGNKAAGLGNRIRAALAKK